MAFNTVIYFVMSFLTSAELSLGVGFGLFAIFSVLRYRTSTMSTREMTYLFVVIALPVMNSLVMRENVWGVLLAVNAVVVAVLFVLEREWGFHYESSQLIRYDRIELITPETPSPAVGRSPAAHRAADQTGRDRPAQLPQRHRRAAGVLR